MTNKLPRIGLYIVFGISCVLLIVNISSIVDIFTSGEDVEYYQPIQQCWLSYCWERGPDHLSWALWGLLFQNSYALLFFLVMIIKSQTLITFRNLFLTLFVVSNLMLSIRFLQLNVMRGDIVSAGGLLITRLTVFAHILGAIMLFMASISAFTKLRSNWHLLITICMIVSFGIAYRIPVDQFLYASNLTGTIGKFFEFQVVLVIIYTITILNVVGKYLYSKTHSAKLFGLAVVALIIGFESVYYLINPQLVVISMIALVTGTICYIASARAPARS